MENILEVRGLNKIYKGGFQALHTVDLNIERGEIFALLGPNGAGKTTLISIICGIVNATQGTVRVDGYDHVRDYRLSRAQIGLVPQELTTEAFESVWHTVRFSRALFNKPKNDAYLEKLLKQLSLWDKRDQRIVALSGGMKRRLMIAKALSHEPKLLFLDEPTAGVDVELRQTMWQQVHELRRSGVTILLTTHYIEEAEMMADRIGIINHGRLVRVDSKLKLMRELGKKQMQVEMTEPLSEVPAPLKNFNINLDAEGKLLTYTYDPSRAGDGIAHFLHELAATNIKYKDLRTQESSLEEIFVQLVKQA